MFGFLFTLMLSVWNGEMYRAYGCAQFESKNLFLQAFKRATLLFCMTLDRATKHRHLQ